MTIPIGTKFLLYKGAPNSSGYKVIGQYSDGQYKCQNLSAHHQLDSEAGTSFPKDVVEKMVNELWQPPGFGIKRKTSSMSLKHKTPSKRKTPYTRRKTPSKRKTPSPSNSSLRKSSKKSN